MSQTEDDDEPLVDVDPADEGGVFDEVDRLEQLSMSLEATALLERMLESPTPSSSARHTARMWIASCGAPPEKAYAYGQELVREQPLDSFAWLALSIAADACGRTEEADAARARAAEIQKAQGYSGRS